MKNAYRLRALAFVVAVAALALPSGLLGTVAAAEDKALLGGGAGIVVDGSYCTLTTIGHDRAGDLVGFTAAHCGGPGAGVSVEGTDGTLGTVAAADGYLDYSVIRFDPAKVTPTANFAGFAINGIGPDPDWRQPTRTLGAATGNYCSHIITMPVPGPARTMPAPFQPGDDGRPVTSDDLLIGLVHRGFIMPAVPLYAPSIDETKMILFSAILGDANAKGGPGAGFVPIPA